MTETPTPPAPSRTPSDGPRMLPGMAMIAIFMLVISMLNVGHALQDRTLAPSARYATLGISSLVIAGVFGFLRLRRWGWALVLGAALFYSLVNVLFFFQSHQYGRLLPAAFSFVFFLYLVRTEIRERML